LRGCERWRGAGGEVAGGLQQGAKGTHGDPLVTEAMQRDRLVRHTCPSGGAVTGNSKMWRLMAKEKAARKPYGAAGRVSQRRSGQVVAQLADQLGLGQRPDESLDHHALDVDVHRRDPGDAVTRGDLGILV